MFARWKGATVKKYPISGIGPGDSGGVGGLMKVLFLSSKKILNY